jgi:hypothetical protein
MACNSNMSFSLIVLALLQHFEIGHPFIVLIKRDFLNLGDGTAQPVSQRDQVEPEWVAS